MAGVAFLLRGGGLGGGKKWDFLYYGLKIYGKQGHEMGMEKM